VAAELVHEKAERRKSAAQLLRGQVQMARAAEEMRRRYAIVDTRRPRYRAAQGVRHDGALSGPAASRAKMPGLQPASASDVPAF
jgi:hypothetical protein